MEDNNKSCNFEATCGPIPPWMIYISYRVWLHSIYILLKFAPIMPAFCSLLLCHSKNYVGKINASLISTIRTIRTMRTTRTIRPSEPLEYKIHFMPAFCSLLLCHSKNYVGKINASLISTIRTIRTMRTTRTIRPSEPLEYKIHCIIMDTFMCKIYHVFPVKPLLIFTKCSRL